MVLARRSVLLLAADGFEDMELLYPLYRLREEVAVTVAGLDDRPVTGKKGYGPVPVGGMPLSSWLPDVLVTIAVTKTA
jgi:putative intracellular protease/amidase